MSRRQINMKDPQSDLTIVYDNITFKAACNYLGSLKSLGKYLGAEPLGEVTKLKFEHGDYYYNTPRRLLLKYTH